jgi:hypothetical protein
MFDQTKKNYISNLEKKDLKHLTHVQSDDTLKAGNIMIISLKIKRLFKDLCLCRMKMGV